MKTLILAAAALTIVGAANAALKSDYGDTAYVPCTPASTSYMLSADPRQVSIENGRMAVTRVDKFAKGDQLVLDDKNKFDITAGDIKSVPLDIVADGSAALKKGTAELINDVQVAKLDVGGGSSFIEPLAVAKHYDVIDQQPVAAIATVSLKSPATENATIGDSHASIYRVGAITPIDQTIITAGLKATEVLIGQTGQASVELQT